MRDRRWDFLYERQKQPVKEYLLERFAAELAQQIARWPPPIGWVSDDLRLRHAEGLEALPGEEGIRLAFQLARLDLEREFEAADRLSTREAPLRWRGPAETAAGRLLVQFLIESCLALKEEAVAARITRSDLAGALELAEKRLASSGA